MKQDGWLSSPLDEGVSSGGFTQYQRHFHGRNWFGHILTLVSLMTIYDMRRRNPSTRSPHCTLFKKWQGYLCIFISLNKFKHNHISLCFHVLITHLNLTKSS